MNGTKLDIFAIGTTLFLFLFATSFLVQNGTANPKHDGPLEHLREMKNKFYVHIVVPMVDKCALWDSGFDKITDTILNGVKKLCETVKALNDWLTDMDKPYKYRQRQLNEITEISQQIFVRISADNLHYLNECKHSLKRIDKNELLQVEKVRANAYEAFEEKFEQIIGEFEKKQNMPGFDTARSLQIACKLHWFGKDMCDLLKNNRAKEKMEWAFELFVANLTVFSFHHEDHPKRGTKGEIQKIVEKWWQSGQHQQIMANQLMSIFESAVNSSSSGK
jgi:hypothetical protein